MYFAITSLLLKKKASKACGLVECLARAREQADESKASIHVHLQPKALSNNRRGIDNVLVYHAAISCDSIARLVYIAHANGETKMPLLPFFPHGHCFTLSWSIIYEEKKNV